MANDAPAAPDMDEDGVDRAQIRAMLERLRKAEEFIAAVVAIRELNDGPPPF